MNGHEWEMYKEDVNETDDQLFVASMLELPLDMRVKFTCDAHRDSLVRIAEAMQDYDDERSEDAQGREWDEEADYYDELNRGYAMDRRG